MAHFQEIEYETYMNEVELNKSIALTVELLEEMKSMNNGGLGKTCGRNVCSAAGKSMFKKCDICSFLSIGRLF